MKRWTKGIRNRPAGLSRIGRPPLAAAALALALAAAACSSESREVTFATIPPDTTAPAPATEPSAATTAAVTAETEDRKSVV